MTNQGSTWSIHIDKKLYKVSDAALTGAQLRSLPTPPISAEYDVLLEVPGEDDEILFDDRVVLLENGMHFFSAPRNITPGR